MKSKKYHYETKEVCVSEHDKKWAIFNLSLAGISAIAVVLIATSETTTNSAPMFFSNLIICVTNFIMGAIRMDKAFEVKKVRVYDKVEPPTKGETITDDHAKRLLLGEE